MPRSLEQGGLPARAAGRDALWAFQNTNSSSFAARSGNVAKLRERLRAGGDINHFHPKDGSPLIAAIRSHCVAAVEWLLANGADANANYGDDTGPLEIALRRPNLEIVGLLLAAGARLRRKSRPYYAVRLKNCLKALGRRR